MPDNDITRLGDKLDRIHADLKELTVTVAASNATTVATLGDHARRIDALEEERATREALNHLTAEVIDVRGIVNRLVAESQAAAGARRAWMLIAAGVGGVLGVGGSLLVRFLF